MNFGINNYFKTIYSKGEYVSSGEKPQKTDIPEDGNLKPLENQLSRPLPRYNMNGIEPCFGNIPTDAKPVTRINIDSNYSTPVDTYATKEELLKFFTEEDIEKYFNYQFVQKSRQDGDFIKSDMWLAYVLKPNIEINGEKITTIQQLKDALKNNDTQANSNVKPPKNAKPVTEIEMDPTFSTPKDTYATKEELLKFFTEKDIEKYFNYQFVQKSRQDGDFIKSDMWLAYVLKPNIEINGEKINTIQELKDALNLK